MILNILFIVGAIAHYSTSADEVKCDRDFRKVGCFVRNLELIPDLLITDLDPTHKNYTTDVDWENYSGSLHSLACRCREKAIGHYKYFGIGMYGECSGANDNTEIDKLFKNADKNPYSCVNGEHGDCDVDDVSECTGSVDYDFFYEIIESSSNSENTKLFEAFSTQTEMTKSKLLTTLKVGKVYEVSFEVYPTRFTTGWSNIIHFSSGSDNSVYGDRIPGVWFRPSSSSATTNKLHICSAIDGKVSYCYDSELFPLNKWIKVKISQTKVSDNYEYVITLNDKKVMQKKNSRPANFDDVKVYTADPWYNAQPGYIKNLKVTENYNDNDASSNTNNKLISQAETSLKRNTAIGDISNLCKEYQISFDVKPMKYGSGWHSIFHISVGGNHVVYGDRTPGIWFRPSSSSAKTNSLHICAPINKNRNHCFNTKAFPLDEWISLKVSQKKELEAYIYRIYINGKEEYKIKNTHALKFYDLKVYAADPWYNAQVGEIRNIYVDGGQC